MNRKIGIFVGIDVYLDGGITPLKGAANDARRLAAFCEDRLRFSRVKALTQDDLRQGDDVLIELIRAVDELGDGDLLVFGFAGHGKSVEKAKGDREQIFLLYNANRYSLERGSYSSFSLSLADIEANTRKPGLRRVFLFDTCRRPINLEDAENRDGEGEERFDGEEIYRDVAVGTMRTRASDSPLAILNACSNGQRAIEVPREKRGLFALSWQESITSELERGRPIILDADFDQLLDRTMDEVAARHQVRRGGQKPTRNGAEIRLFGLQDRSEAETDKLLAAFETHLQAGRLESPVGDCGRDTLHQLLLKGVPDDRWRELASRLQQALDAERLARDRAHDQRLIEFARQRPSEQLYLNYLSQCRLSEHQDEAKRFLDEAANARQEAAAWADARRLDTTQAYLDYLQRYPQGGPVAEAQRRLAELAADADQAAHEQRDIERRARTLRDGGLAAWRQCARDAETEALRRDAAAAVVKLEAADRQAWEMAAKEDSEASYALYMAQQREGDQRTEAGKRHAVRRAKRLDREAWATVIVKKDDVQAFGTALRGYLNDWPQGEGCTEATRLLAALSKPQPLAANAGSNTATEKTSRPETPPYEPPPRKPVPVWIKLALLLAGLVAIGVGLQRFLETRPPTEKAPTEGAQSPPAAPATSLAQEHQAPIPSAEPAPAPPDLAAWRSWTEKIESGKWWNVGGAIGDDETKWVTETLAHASAEQWPRAQFLLGVLHCTGRAAAQVPLDVEACGQWFAKALANPELQPGTERDRMVKSVVEAYQKLVLEPPPGAKAERAFARALLPGLQAQQAYPGIALRLAVTQGCFQEPPDAGAARKSLQGLLAHHPDSVEAADAKRLLATWQASGMPCATR